MICAIVVKATNIERRLKEALNKVGDLLKAEKWTTRTKKVIIKELEDKIVTLSSNPSDGSQIKSLITTKDNEISNLKKQLKIPNVHLVQTIELKMVEQEKEYLLETMVKYKGLA